MVKLLAGISGVWGGEIVYCGQLEMRLDSGSSWLMIHSLQLVFDGIGDSGLLGYCGIVVHVVS